VDLNHEADGGHRGDSTGDIRQHDLQRATSAAAPRPRTPGSGRAWRGGRSHRSDNGLLGVGVSAPAPTPHRRKTPGGPSAVVAVNEKREAAPTCGSSWDSTLARFERTLRAFSISS
jgi:hypothetical protein